VSVEFFPFFYICPVSNILLSNFKTLFRVPELFAMFLLPKSYKNKTVKKSYHIPEKCSTKKMKFLKKIKII